MKNLTIKNATIYDNGTMTALIGVSNAKVADNTVIKKDDGSVLALPPQEQYEKDGVKKYARVLTYANGEAMSAAAAALLDAPTDDIFLYAEPFAVNGGSKVGIATLTGDVTLKVTVIKKEDGTYSLVLPGRKYTNKEGKTRTAYFVWPFDTKGDELKAEIDALVADIVAQAKPYVESAE
jgi:hypothetical protein